MTRTSCAADATNQGETAHEPQPAGAGSSRKRLFISYRRNVTPDEALAREVFQALSQHADVFIDQTLPVGTRWAESIEAELRRTDFLIVFLSHHSVHSEMVQAEVERAHQLGKEQGRPAILPVRLAHREPLQYPLNAYLNPIHWAYWGGPEDTPRLIEELRRAIAGAGLRASGDEARTRLVSTGEPSALPLPLPYAQPTALESPEGTISVESGFYEVRSSDAVALAAIRRQGATITIKGPRQMGKSSLLIRTMAAAAQAGKRVAFIDFQLFERSVLTHADLFFRRFCAILSRQLRVKDQVTEFWQAELGNSYSCTLYVGDYLLQEIEGPALLAMDEVESVLDTDFRSDFFAMLRNWHNIRAYEPAWRRLDLALVTSTEPYQLIDNLNQSPFNVGEVIDLADFTAEQVANLNRRHGRPLVPAEEQQLMGLLGGHPYLVRRALYLVASERLSPRDLFETATGDRGPFGDHLRYHLFRIHDKADLVEGLLQVLRENRCPDERVFFRLRGAGLVRREGQAVLPRCALYADYFRERLVG